ncbi:alpha/beta hydrolase [Orrella marina]|uniref:Alpha/beta hydrolase n=1 Tax=Orrella marina TaxID=2163011 RepID=A0A2R4XLA9_9BURK|nr:CocE/NonD family hydrolase [Orrella marina]AWB34588.1 alpha/beta hydrolase [Orrella marina]
MASKTQKMMFQGLVGDIDCALDWPDGEPQGWALVLHPNPVQGGTRDNKVVTTISRACVQRGLVAVRPNFRGIGSSAGEFDEGRGETQDMKALVEQFSEQFPDIAAGKWVLGGFSFGTSIGLQLYGIWQAADERLPDAVILAGSAALRFRHLETVAPDDALIVHGENDDVVPLSEVMDWARPIDMPVVVVPNAGHFFHGKLLILRHLVQTRLRAL